MTNWPWYLLHPKKKDKTKEKRSNYSIGGR